MELKKIPSPIECAEDLYMCALAFKESYDRFKAFATFLHIANPNNGYQMESLFSTVINSLSQLTYDIRKG